MTGIARIALSYQGSSIEEKVLFSDDYDMNEFRIEDKITSFELDTPKNHIFYKFIYTGILSELNLSLASFSGFIPRWQNFIF